MGSPRGAQRRRLWGLLGGCTPFQRRAERKAHGLNRAALLHAWELKRKKDLVGVASFERWAQGGQGCGDLGAPLCRSRGQGGVCTATVPALLPNPQLWTAPGSAQGQTEGLPRAPCGHGPLSLPGLASPGLCHRESPSCTFMSQGETLAVQTSLPQTASTWFPTPETSASPKAGPRSAASNSAALHQTWPQHRRPHRAAPQPSPAADRGARRGPPK